MAAGMDLSFDEEECWDPLHAHDDEPHRWGAEMSDAEDACGPAPAAPLSPAAQPRRTSLGGLVRGRGRGSSLADAESGMAPARSGGVRPPARLAPGTLVHGRAAFPVATG